MNLTNEFVLECSSQNPHVQLSQLEEDLQKVLHDVDHSALFQTEVLLDVLHHLGPILPPTSVISWFDIVLRPALREPKLPTATLNHAKDLIVFALRNTEDGFSDKVGDFRRRLLDLYLLDAFNEGSGDDLLEWAELDEEQREKRTHWKCNLEDLLLKFATERPQDLLTEIYVHFEEPASRLQLFILLNLYTSGPSFQASSMVLATHPLMTSVLRSLMLDNSSTVCTIGLTLLVKLLPVFAVHARGVLKSMLPGLLAVLARLLCWKERPPSGLPVDDPPSEELERELENEINRIIPIRSTFHWRRLESTFNATPSHPPSPRPYFTALYYLYPSNVLRFSSNPTLYLVDHSYPSPYTLEWHQVFPEDEIRKRSERLIREHVCHPLLIWRDATAELSEPEFWTRYSVARITCEAGMLDVRSNALGIAATQSSGATAPHQPLEDGSSGTTDEEQLPTHIIRPIELSPGRTSISIRDMISTAVALKSNMDVQVVNPVSQWPHLLFSPPVGSTTSLPVSSDSVTTPPQIIQVISALQREALLLRNELNFELWLSRENVQHIGRLYEDRILSKTAETERQGLFNKLRKYRNQVINLEAELREHKQQASSAKNRYADWNTELQKKLRELKEEKKAWIFEAAALRSAAKEAQALFEAQGKLLANASEEVFELQTQKKETQHKIDRLRDYERQIEQHIKIQRLWDDDFAKFNDQASQISLMQSQYRQLEMRLESHEKTQAKMEDSARANRRKIQALEARLLQAHQISDSKQHPGPEIAVFAAESSTLMETNNKLKDENMLLKDELEEMRAMIELLKGRKGLISEPRASAALSV